MRLFVAIDLPEKAQKALRALQKKLPTEGIRLVRDFHITLQFIGEVSLQDAEKIKKALAEIHAQFLDIRWSKPGFFGSARCPRVLWMGLEPQLGLIALAKQISTRLSLFGIRRDDEFKPHVTLVRVKGNCGDLSSFLSSRFSHDGFTATEFHLYESVIGADGETHKKIATYQLNADIS